ncbi:TPA: hypothetical protein ACX6S7_002456 [Photobacterium damselae]
MDYFTTTMVFGLLVLTIIYFSAGYITTVISAFKTKKKSDKARSSYSVELRMYRMEQAIVKLIKVIVSFTFFCFSFYGVYQIVMSEDFLSTTTNDLTPKSQITVSQKCEGIDCNSLSQ